MTDVEDRGHEISARMADTLVTQALRALLEAGYDANGLASGASVAIVRHTIEHLTAPGAVPTVRGVLSTLLAAINKAAEQLLAKPTKVN